MPWAVLLPKRRAKRKCLLKEIIHSMSSSHEYCTWAIRMAKKLGLGGGTAKSVSRKSMRQNYVSLLFYQGMGR